VAAPLTGPLDAYVYQSARRERLEKLKQFRHERCKRFEAVGRGDEKTTETGSVLRFC
jgi:hypothetical protein